VPEGWEVRRLKHVASVQVSNVDKHSKDDEEPVRLCNYVDVYYNDFIDDAMAFMNATATSTEIAKFRLSPGDVLVTKDSESWDDIAVPALVRSAGNDLLCGYHLAQIRPALGRADGDYLSRQVGASGPSHQFKIEATGVTRYGLGKYALDNALLAVPPLPEQRAIAAFLDCETTRIDALIQRKQRQIELLQEKRVALISHAVTKGLDPNAKMKGSGIAWLGEIPTHWGLVQLRRAVRRFVDYRGRTPEKVDSGIPLVTARNIKEGLIDLSLSEEFMREEDYEAWMVRGWPEEGDVLVTTEAPLGETAHVTDTHIALAQRIILLKVNRSCMENEYLKYHFLSGFGQGELRSRATGSTAVGIKAEHLKGSLVLVPPLEEQAAIVHHLEREVDSIRGPLAKIGYSVALLREYRTALISAAVTGRIDVRKETA
jgi:type I restriction enzyme S subunit